MSPYRAGNMLARVLSHAGVTIPKRDGVGVRVLPRFRWPSAQRHPWLATRCGAGSLSSSCLASQTSEEYVQLRFLLAGAAIVAGTSSLVSNVTLLEEEASLPVVADATHNAATTQNDQREDKEEDDKGEEDPYANLPEEDEPTECSMCNTFRQGPCRPYWRKLERCFKDHEGEENGAQKCMRYFMPHQKCLMNYTNLYNLVRLTNLQEYIDETEETLPKNQRRKMDTPLDIDWSLWDQFTKDAGPSFTQGLVSSSISKDTPLWKRFPLDTEPVVLTFSTQIPRQDEAGLLLRFAYVVDQDGKVLGVESNPIYRKLKDQVEGRIREEIDVENEEAEPPAPNMILEFYIVPSMTQKVQVKAMYAMDPTTPGLENDGKDDVLKESSFVELGVHP
eukprot:scaffold8374_cov175-Amphora_coffeaeformis.AAC.30